MPPWPAAKPGGSGLSRRPCVGRGPTVQYFSCARCATATNTSAASPSPAGSSMSYASVMGPRSNLSTLSAEPRTSRRTKRWPRSAVSGSIVTSSQPLHRTGPAESNEWDVAIQQSLAGSAGPVAAASPRPDPFSLADPPTVEQILGAAGFIGVNFTDVDEPVYYGSDVAAALDWVRGFTCTNEVLNRLDPAAAARALGRLREALSAHPSDDGVWFNSRAWISSPLVATEGEQDRAQQMINHVPGREVIAPPSG
jgi:hypothetical protein